MKIIILFLAIISITSCGKKLDLKPNSSIVLPKTIKDLEMIMDNRDLTSTPALPQISGDEYFIPSLQEWQALSNVTSRNASLWQSEVYESETRISDWIMPYKAIFYSNNVLEVLSTGSFDSGADAKRLKGWAMFVRAYSFYSLVSTFGKSYDADNAANDLGVPLKINAGIDEILPRSSLQQTYDQIIKDALEASELLPQQLDLNRKTRPSKASAYALLARVFISMRNYVQAEQYADKALELYSTITDFKSLNKASATPFTTNSPEVIYFTEQVTQYNDITYSFLSTSYGITQELINLYKANDLRLFFYFQKNTLGNYNMKPVNTSTFRPFTGLATDEIFLIKSECLARRGETGLSMDILNQLVSNRWDPNATSPAKSYQAIIASNADEALDEVLIERRKSLIWRGLRWTDLKRLNLENRNITLTRDLSGKIFRLEPNSPKYVLPIPGDEVALSGIQQNAR